MDENEKIMNKSINMLFKFILLIKIDSMLKNKIKIKLIQITSVLCLLSLPVLHTNASPNTSNVPDLIAQSNSDEKKSEPTNDEEKTTTEEDQEDQKKIKPGSKNSEMIDKFTRSLTKHTLFEHIMVNMTYGIISGGLIGAGGGFILYDKRHPTPSHENIQLFALAGVGVGGLTAVTIGIIERFRGKPFSIGPGVFNYGWYGAFGGIMLGGVSGSIVYVSSNNTDDILHGVGYGAIGGFVAGTLLHILLPKSSTFKIDFLPGPKNNFVKVSWQF